MPDGTTATPEAPPVKMVDTLTVGGEIKPNAFSLRNVAEQAARDQIRESEARNKKIQDLKNAEGESPEAALASLGKKAEVPEYTQRDLSETITAVGKPAGLEATLKPIAQYLEAIKLSQRQGTDLNTELDKISDIRQEIGKLILNRGGLFEKFPVLKTAFGGNETAAATYIEQNLGRDSIFQKTIVKELTEIHDAAKDLPPPGKEAEELKKLTDNRDKIKDVRDQQIDSFKQKLAAEDLTDPAIIEDILKSVNAGDPNLTLSNTVDAIIKAKGIQSIPWLESYTKQESIVNTEQNRKRGLEAQLNTETAKGQKANTTRVTDLRNQIQQADTDITAAETARNNTKKHYMDTFSIDDAKFTNQLQGLQSAKDLKDPQSSISQTINFIHSSDQKFNEAQAQVDAVENNPEVAQKIKEANKARQDLLRRLEGVVDTAVAETLTQRYNKLVEDNNILLEASKKKAEKSGKTWKAGGIDRIKNLSKSMGEYNPKTRKFEYKPENIGKIAHNLATYSAEGENGTRVMFAKEIGFKLDPQELKDSVASEILRNRKYDELTPEQKLDADNIIQQRTVDFEAIYAEHSENFNKRVFETFAASRGFMDKIGKGNLSLSDDEIRILNKQFGTLMDSELEKTGLKKALKEMGAENNGKLKILLAILAILAASVTITAAAPAVMAAGAAAKGAASL